MRRKRRAHLRMCSANTGELSSSSTAIPGHCPPWPGNTNPTRASRRAGPHQPVDRLAALERPPGQRQLVDESGASTTARCANAARQRQRAPDGGRVELGGCLDELPQPRRLRLERRLARPGHQEGQTPGTGSGAARARRATTVGSGGASSRIRCAFVPLIPNEDTPAGAPRTLSAGQSAARSAAGPARRPSRRAARARPRAGVGGSTPCRSAITILITPATPAAAWVWPMLDFSEPSHSGPSRASRP